MYTTARIVFGWSDEEFWNATPKKYFAVLYKYSEMRNELSASPKQPTLVGQDAFQALSAIVSRVR